MSPTQLIRAVVAVSVIAVLAGCSAQTPATTSSSVSEASATPTTTPSAAPSTDPVAVAPTCENLVSPETFSLLSRTGYALVTDWTGEPDGSFHHLKPFADRGGVVCIWGNPDYPEQPWAYAWSRLDAASSSAMQETFAGEGLTRATSASGIVFSGESQTYVDSPYGYLLRDGDWFFNLDLPDLEPLAARFDAL